MRRPDFHGAEYVANIDHDRLKTQQERVEDFMLDGQFHTLEEISLGSGAPPASASAQLRNLSDPKTGTYARERRPRGDRAKGLFEYRLIRRPPANVGRAATGPRVYSSTGSFAVRPTSC